MPATSKSPIVPDEALRRAACERPTQNVIMYQEWRDLLFLHWQYPASVIQATLPDGLFVDTFDGNAFLGIVPFFMRNIRPRFLPAVPWLSNFLELNLRTYVHDRHGVPGVWFYTLEANQPIAVALARRFFHLPYQHARMQADRLPSGAFRYESRRTTPNNSNPSCIYEYTPTAALSQPRPSSLEFFLIERYRLYSKTPNGLRRGAVHHPPYPLFQAKLAAYDENLLALERFAPTRRPPDHIAYSPGVSVDIFPLQSI